MLGNVISTQTSKLINFTGSLIKSDTFAKYILSKAWLFVMKKVF